MSRFRISLLIAALGFAACGSESLPAKPPTKVSLVVDQGFESPMDAVVSPDGQTFYFTAYDTSPTANPESAAAVFAVPANGGALEVLFEGPPLEDPSGLVLSCDGQSLYIADIAAEGAIGSSDVGADESPLYRLDLSSRALTPIPAYGIREAGSLALSQDCSTMYVTGYNDAGEPALFTLPPTGGAALTVKAGAPLISPSGVYVDKDNIAWVMDQTPNDDSGGKLFAVQPDGTTTPVLNQIGTSEPAGVSLVAGGGVAVIPHRDRDSGSQLMTVEIATGNMTVIETPEMVEPAGLRTSIGASVMAVVDMDGNAIYRAE